MVIVPKRRGNRNAKPPVSSFEERDVSDKSMRRIKKVARNWSLVLRYALNNKQRYLKIKPQFVFITLTLASQQKHTDQVIKRQCFQPFLADVAKACKCEINYIWRAEAQENGNIHFHVLIDRYVDKHWVTSTWNRLQDRIGYVERSTVTNPPSTRIEVVNDPENVADYCAKYMCKSKGNYRGIAGRLWGCSNGLKELDCRLDLEMSALDVMTTTDRAIENGAEVNIMNEYVTMILFKQKPLELFIGATLFAQFWERVGYEYLKLAPIFEGYTYVNYSLS